MSINPHSHAPKSLGERICPEDLRISYSEKQIWIEMTHACDGEGSTDFWLFTGIGGFVISDRYAYAVSVDI